ncbi:MAG: sigma-E factor negative regulatory protein [Xanthomonadales bacterium]|nr:sigma-E factor negative regulatory protein [Xanthomonadales bacterium]
MKDDTSNTSNGFQMEDVSVLMDGEMPNDTSVFLLRRMQHEDGLGSKWQRYHLIRDVICEQNVHITDTAFCDCIRNRCAQAEPVIAVSDTQLQAGNSQRWFKPVLGIAMTAAVAFVAVTSVVQQPLNDQGLPSPDSIQQASLADVGERPDFVTPENPLITAASGRVMPASGVSSGGLNITYPLLPGNSQTTTAEYLFRHNQLEGDVGRPVFILNQPRNRSVLIISSPQRNMTEKKAAANAH